MFKIIRKSIFGTCVYNIGILFKRMEVNILHTNIGYIKLLHAIRKACTTRTYLFSLVSFDLNESKHKNESRLEFLFIFFTYLSKYFERIKMVIQRPRFFKMLMRMMLIMLGWFVRKVCCTGFMWMVHSMSGC